jgi:uncharacterized caspase-like protein
MKQFIFRITIKGFGSTVDSAWIDATDSLAQDPGPTPEIDEYEEIVDPDDEEPVKKDIFDKADDAYEKGRNDGTITVYDDKGTHDMTPGELREYNDEIDSNV